MTLAVVIVTVVSSLLHSRARAASCVNPRRRCAPLWSPTARTHLTQFSVPSAGSVRRPDTHLHGTWLTQRPSGRAQTGRPLLGSSGSAQRGGAAWGQKRRPAGPPDRRLAPVFSSRQRLRSVHITGMTLAGLCLCLTIRVLILEQPVSQMRKPPEDRRDVILLLQYYRVLLKSD